MNELLTYVLKGYELHTNPLFPCDIRVGRKTSNYCHDAENGPI